MNLILLTTTPFPTTPKILPSVVTALCLLAILLCAGNVSFARWQPFTIPQAREGQDVIFSFPMSNGNGQMAAPYYLTGDGSVDTSQIAMYNLDSGSISWIRSCRYDSNILGTGSSKEISVVTANSVLYYQMFNHWYLTEYNLNGDLIHPQHAIDTLNQLNPWSTSIDDSSRAFFFCEYRDSLWQRVVALCRISATGVLDMIVPMPDTMVIDHGECVRDGYGGAIVWLKTINPSNHLYDHYLCHVNRDGVIDVPPVFYRSTLYLINSFGMYYAYETGLLFIPQAFDGSGCISYFNATTLQPTETRAFTVPETSNLVFASSPDTVWMAFADDLPVTGHFNGTYLTSIDSEGMYHVVDHIDTLLLPNSAMPGLLTYKFVVHAHELSLIFKSHGVSRRSGESSIVSGGEVSPIPSRFTFSLYPNPTNGWIVVKGFAGAKTQWSIYNLLGQNILTGQTAFGNRSTSIRLPSSLASGSYWLQIENERHQNQTMRIQLMK